MQVLHMKGRRIPASIKIAAGGAVAIAVILGGWKMYSAERVRNFQMTEIAPGRVNLIAVQPAAGWRIIVSNSIVQLAEVTGHDQDKDEDAQNGKRLPMREYIASMQGDGDAVGYLVEKLADISDDSIPINAPVWSPDDIEKAIAGDPQLKRELERDIQCRLDGTPNSELSISALVNGIIIEVPVTLKIKVDGKPAEVTGKVRTPYISDLAERVAEKAINKKFDSKDEVVVGVYQNEGYQILNGDVAKEDVLRSLRSRYSPGRIRSLAEKPQFLLDNSTVLVTDKHVEGASVDVYTSGNKQYADVTLSVNDEGKMRLWKYSHDNPGFQLLLVVDGLAYAAPKITTQLAERYIQITGLNEPDLARQATDRINEIHREPAS